MLYVCASILHKIERQQTVELRMLCCYTRYPYTDVQEIRPSSFSHIVNVLNQNLQFQNLLITVDCSLLLLKRCKPGCDIF